MGGNQAVAMKYTNTVPFTAGGSETESIIPGGSGANSLLPDMYVTSTPTTGGGKKEVKAKRTRKTK
jgi:hypothetical protein